MWTNSKKSFSIVDPDRPYSMDLPKLGHAVIMNNIATEFPGSLVDVKALETAYKKVGFETHVHLDCDRQDMIRVRQWMMREDIHTDCNTFALAVIGHGNKRGEILDSKKYRSWNIEDIVEELNLVQSLIAKPKIIVIQACRGIQWNQGQTVPCYALADEENEPTHILPDKADMFLAYASVPGYVAHAGDEEGSPYIQAFAHYLQEEYMRRPLEKIYLMVKQYMIEIKQGEEGLRQSSEERNSLTRVLDFSKFQGTPKLEGGSRTEEAEAERVSLAQQKSEIAIEVISTSDTGLLRWKYSRFVVMPSSGDVIIWGKHVQQEPLAFHHFIYKDRKLQKINVIKPLCDHQTKNMLPLNLPEGEQLAVSCTDCHLIWMLNLETSHLTQVLKMNQPTIMTHGEPGNFYITYYNGGVLEASQISYEDKFRTAFSLTIPELNRHYDTCYMCTYKHLVVTGGAGSEVNSFSITGKKMWKTSLKDVQGETYKAYGLLYLKKQDKLLVASGRSSILVLDPRDGAVLQIIPLRKEGSITTHYLYLCGENVFMTYILSGKIKVALLSIT